MAAFITLDKRLEFRAVAAIASAEPVFRTLTNAKSA